MVPNFTGGVFFSLFFLSFQLTANPRTISLKLKAGFNFQVGNLNSGEEVNLYFSETKEACTGTILTQGKALYNFAMLAPLDFSPKPNKKYYFSAKVTSTTPNICSETLEYNSAPEAVPKVELNLKNGITVGKEKNPLFVITGLKNGYKANIYKDDACLNATPLKTISATGDSTEFILTITETDQKKHNYYAQGLTNNGIKGICSTGVSYTLDLTNPPATLSIEETNSRGPNRQPSFKVSGLIKGDNAVLFSNKNCQGSVVAQKTVRDNSTSIILKVGEYNVLLNDGNYNFSVKVTDLGGNFTCSKEIQYTLDATASSATVSLKIGTTIPSNNTNPNFTISNVTAGDKVALYRDNKCSNRASNELTVPASKSSIDISANISATTETTSYTFYAQAKDSLNNIGRCSPQGATYTYQKAVPPSGSSTTSSTSTGTTSNKDTATTTNTGNGTTNNATQAKENPLIIKENNRILDLPYGGLERKKISEFFVTQKGFSSIDVDSRKPTVKTILDSVPYKNAYIQPWIASDQLVPYVIRNDGKLLSLAGHSMNKILSDLEKNNATTITRIVRDYRNLKFNSSEFKNDMIQNGWVWLHDLSKNQNIINSKKQLDPVWSILNQGNLNPLKETEFCDTSKYDLVYKDTTYYCVFRFNPDTLYTETFESITSSKTSEMTPEPYLSITYLLRNGIDPSNPTKQDTKTALFNTIDLSGKNLSSETTIIDYIGNLITNTDYLFQDNKWALYIKYRLQRDYNVTYNDLQKQINSTDTTLKSEFRKNVCRAQKIARDQETYKLANDNLKWFPGYKWINTTTEPWDVPPAPTWCDPYKNDMPVMKIN